MISLPFGLSLFITCLFRTPNIVAVQRYVIPLPDLEKNKGVLPEFPVGSTVLGLYPDTSCFYRAEVMATPKQMQSSAVSFCVLTSCGFLISCIRQAKLYKLKFEDDEDQEHTVSAEWVVEYPAGLA